MFSHIMLGARDLKKMTAFYDDVLSPLGMRRVAGTDGAEEAGVIWQRGDRRWPQFALRCPFNGLPARWGNGVQSVSLHPRGQSLTCSGPWRSRRARKMRALPVYGFGTRTISTPLTVAIPKATSFVLSAPKGSE